MKTNKTSVKTKDGELDYYSFYDESNSLLPVIIVYMDAFGIRDSLTKLSQRFAAEGYFVVLPNLFYREGEFKPFNAATAFGEPIERERLTGYMQKLNLQNVTDDTCEIITSIRTQYGNTANVSRIGTVGYCMGGKFALASAAGYPDIVMVAASIHGGGLATDKPTSPHLLIPKIKAKIYIGIAENDRGFSSEDKQRLESALTASNADYEMEVYPGAAHGFAIGDHTVYKKDAAERHFEALFELFDKTLKSD